MRLALLLCLVVLCAAAPKKLRWRAVVLRSTDGDAPADPVPAPPLGDDAP